MTIHPAISKFVLIPFLLSLASGQAQDTRRLTGTVSDATSAPLEGVSVLLSSMDRVFQIKSNTAGKFRFENVPSGFYELEFSAPGFMKQTLPVEVAGNTSQSLAIVLKIGSMPDMNYCGPHPSIVYGPLSAIKPQLGGIIQDYENHRPVAKVEVTVWRAGERISMHRTDQAGEFAFPDLPAGHYDLRILRPGY